LARNCLFENRSLALRARFPSPVPTRRRTHRWIRKQVFVQRRD
jgi:hypothetical protein